MSRARFTNIAAVVALGLLGGAVGQAFRPAADAVTAPAEEAWPAPAQDSIDYLASIDLRTLHPRIPGTEAVRYDSGGQPVVPGARARFGRVGLFSQEAWVEHVVASADGRWVAWASCAGNVRICEQATGREVYRPREETGARVLTLAFTPDGRQLVIARQRYVRWEIDRKFVPPPEHGLELQVLDLETNTETLTPVGAIYATAAAFSADARLLIVGGYHRRDINLEVWDVATLSLERTVGLNARVARLAYAPHGKQLALRTDEGSVHTLDLATGCLNESLGQSDNRRGCLQFSADGKFLLHDQATPRLLNLLTHTESPFAFGNQGPCLRGVALAPDGRTLATPGDRQQVDLWEVSTGRKRRVLPIVYRETTALAFTANGRGLFGALPDGTVLVWDFLGPKEPKGRLSPQLLESLWTALDDASDGVRSFDALWAMAAAPEDTVPFLLRRALEQKPQADARQIARWLADLDAKEFEVRQEAFVGLEKHGRPFLATLQAARAAAPPLEVARRLDDLLDELPQSQEPPDCLATHRAIEVLETIGSAVARRALEELARHSADEACQADAQASLHRLKRKPEVPAEGAP